VTSRNDEVTVEHNSSPRVIEVIAPFTEWTMQDHVDTLRVEEHSFTGMSQKKLLNASGKEDLGGGVKVGITAASQDVLVSFEGRTTPAQTGTVTSNPGSPIAGRDSFIDTAATFVTNSLSRGSLVINFTDNSVAEVVSIQSETQITTKTLVNGIGNTFDTSDVYHVFNVIQCRAVGGNLTAVNSSQVAISPILPTAFTQVLLTSSSSATLQELADIQYSSFGGGVTVDVVNGVPGIIYPTGTPRQPCDNIEDAHLILDDRGFIEFLIRGDLTLSAGSHRHIFVGQSPNRTLITVDPGVDVEDAQFFNCSLTGTLDDNSEVINCTILNLNLFNGRIKDCLIDDTATITLGGGVEATISNSRSTLGASIDMGGSGQELKLINHTGTINIKNKTGSDPVHIFLNSGTVFIESTCTAGLIRLHGVGVVFDSSGPGCTVNSDQLVSGVKLTDIHRRLDLDTGTVNTYADDGSVITNNKFTLTKDDNGDNTFDIDRT